MDKSINQMRSESGIPRLGAGWIAVSLTALLALGVGCSSDDGDNGGDGGDNETSGIEISGTWSSGRGVTHQIDQESWVTGSGAQSTTYTVVSYDNEKNRAIRKSTFMGETSYDRTVWTAPSGGEFFFCTVVFGKSSAEAARTAEPQQEPDFDNPSSSDACGGMFPFTRLTEGAAPEPDAGTGDAGSPDAGAGDTGS